MQLVHLLIASALAYSPRVQLKRQNDIAETGGNFGCFGFSAQGNNHLTAILFLSPNTEVKFYKGTNCKGLIGNGGFVSSGALDDPFTHTDIQSLRLVPYGNGGSSTFDDSVEYDFNNPATPAVQFRLRKWKTETGGNIGCFGVQAIGDNRIQEILQLTPGIQVTFYKGFGCQKPDLVLDGSGMPVVQKAPGPVTPEISYTDVNSIRLKPIGTSRHHVQNHYSEQSYYEDSSNYDFNNPGAPAVQFKLRKWKTETGGNIGCFGVQAIGDNRIQEILQLTPGIQVTFYKGFGCQKPDLVLDGSGMPVVQKAPGPVTPEISYTDVNSIRLKPIGTSKYHVQNWENVMEDEQEEDYENSQYGKDYSEYDFNNPSAPAVQFRLRQWKVETGGSVGCFGVQAIGANRIQEILQLTPGIQVTFYKGFGCQKPDLVLDGSGMPVVQKAPGPVTPEISYTDVNSIRLKPVGTSQRFRHNDLNYGK